MKLPKEFPSTGYKNHSIPILWVNFTFFFYHREPKEKQDQRHFLISDTRQEASPTTPEGHLNARECLTELLPLQNTAWSAALWRWYRHHVQLHKGALWKWSILSTSGIFHQVTERSPYNTEHVLGFYNTNFANWSIKYKTMRPLQLQTNTYMNSKPASPLPLLPLTYRAEKPCPIFQKQQLGIIKGIIKSKKPPKILVM